MYKASASNNPVNPGNSDNLGSSEKTAISPERFASIRRDLENLRQMGSVLYIAAHPDDENTELLAYLVLGRHFRTAYLSLTRGDGGQNVLGPDLGEKLGVARTQELLAARRLDGAQQFFSRAIDFGFSKSYSETLNNWNKQEILSDTVRVIRQFRPDVMITRFSPSPGGTHGHHTASTVLALEAFKLAGDAKAFPEQSLAPWQPKRILWNTSPWQHDKLTGKNSLRIDTSGKDIASGESFTDIAEESRAQHKTQGFDSFKIQGDRNVRSENFELLGGEAPISDIMDGVDTTWARLPGGVQIGADIDKIIAAYDDKAPAKSVGALLELRKQLHSLDITDSVVAEKSLLLDRILQECLGLHAETTIPQADVVPGETLTMHHTVSIAGGAGVDVQWFGVSYPAIKETHLGKEVVLSEVGGQASLDDKVILPVDTAITQPYYLRSAGTPGTFAVNDPSLIGSPENRHIFPIEYRFNIKDKNGVQQLFVMGEPVQVSKNASGRTIKRRLDVIAPVSLHFVQDVLLTAPGGTQTIELQVMTSRAGASGTVGLVAPEGWQVSPASQPFSLARLGESKIFKFTVKAPAKTGSARITAVADIGGHKYSFKREEVNYAHIPVQLLQSEAAVKVVSVELATKGQTVGYLSGAGDTVVQNLHQMGYDVKILNDDSSPADLAACDAIVLGVRAFNVRENIAKIVPSLMQYIENGGTMIVQYNRPDKLKSDKIAPYDLHISADRVTDENAEVTFLDPDSPVLNTPNKISKADFQNWVQERGLYFPRQWDYRFKPVIAIADAGEQPMKGSLLIAQYGKGHYVYSGLSFFRQLPAGVPGAYRLLANLIALSK